MELLPANTGEPLGSPNRLQEIESQIESGYRMIGEGLAEIVKDRLYLPEYKNFGDYVATRWGYSRQWAYQMITAAKTAKQLSKILDIELARPSHAVALGKVPEADLPVVIELIEQLPPKERTAGAIRAAHEQVEQVKNTGYVEIAPGVLTHADPNNPHDPNMVAGHRQATMENWKRHLEKKNAGKKPPILELYNMRLKDVLGFEILRRWPDKPQEPMDITIREFSGGDGYTITIRKKWKGSEDGIA